MTLEDRTTLAGELGAAQAVAMFVNDPRFQKQAAVAARLLQPIHLALLDSMKAYMTPQADSK